MRSHPYTPAPPLPPILDDIATMIPLPNQVHRAHDDMDVPLGELDSETGHLLPAKRRRHRVRVQGRLALVRSISTANLQAPGAAAAGTQRYSMATTAPSSPSTPRFETALAGRTSAAPKSRMPRRRRSLDDDGCCSDTDEDDEAETIVRDRQLRGYGIGGVGNIRKLYCFGAFCGSLWTFADLSRPADRGHLRPDAAVARRDDAGEQPREAVVESPRLLGSDGRSKGQDEGDVRKSIG